MALLKFTWAFVLVSGSCLAANLQGCTSVRNVTCKDGTATFGLEQDITEIHSQCEPGIYDKDGNLTVEVDGARLLKDRSVTIDSCPPEFHLKMQCNNKMNNLVICFRVINDPVSDPLNEAVNDPGNDPGNDPRNDPSADQTNNSHSLLWLLLIPVVLVIVAVIVRKCPRDAPNTVV